MAKKGPIKEAMTKTQVYAEIAEGVGISKKEVSAVFDELGDIIHRHLKKGGCGTFTMPGLLKVKTVKKPAKKAQKNVPNPFRPGEFMDVAAKPASTKVKVAPLKKMKDFVA
jgi:nucleoid DNA-binding protein